MRFVLTALGTIHLHNLELTRIRVPMEDALHTSPSTPFEAPPARLRAAHAVLREARDVNVGAVRAWVTPPDVPSSVAVLHTRRSEERF